MLLRRFFYTFYRWEGPWLRQDGFYTATVLRYTEGSASNRRQANRRKEGQYTLQSNDYPDNIFSAFDHQVREVNTAKGLSGKNNRNVKNPENTSKQQYLDFFHMKGTTNGEDENTEDDLEYSSDDSDFDGSEAMHSIFTGPSPLSRFQPNDLLNNMSGLPRHHKSIITPQNMIRALTPPVDTFLSSFHRVGKEKRGRIRGKKRQTSARNRMW